MELTAPRTVVGPALPLAAEAFARWLSSTVTPPLCAVVAAAVAASHVGSAEAWLWAGAFAALGVVVPTGYIIHLYRRGRVSDLHLNRREERTRPLIVAVVASGGAAALLWSAAAPPLLLAIAAVQLLQTLLFLAVTLRWKISAHCAGTAGLAAVCWWVHGGVALPVLVLLPAMAWARVILQRHTVAQTAAGTAAGLVLWLLALAVLPAT